jgi:hypothetical protein
MRVIAKAGAILILLVCAGRAQAEYCLDWSSFITKHSGSSGHCWATERECDSYRSSRPAGDYVGGCYYRPGKHPRSGTQKGGKASAARDAAAKAAAEQKKLDASKRQQAAAERQAHEKDRQELLHTMKGVPPSAPARTILLKPVPPAGSQARSQLDCVVRNEPGESWEKQAKDCTPVVPDVPGPPQPTRVEEPGARDKAPSQ